MKRKGDWIQTFTGRKFWPLDPRPSEVFIEDIAHSLSNLCRFNGHCTTFYSVAEHSVLVSENVPSRLALLALLHDAPEAYFSDIPRPVKMFMPQIKKIERSIEIAILKRFGFDMVTAEERDIVKAADNAILADEAEQIMVVPPDKWIFYENALGIPLLCFSPQQAEKLFLDRFYRLEMK
jgi:5'-deoxynucleotidase YfbR-like HD superfamily hydrolase